MSAHAVKPHLTDDQVFELNEKHGWFSYGDSQSDVSKAFAQDAIEMHKRMQDAAPELLAACIQAYGNLSNVHNNWPGRGTMAGQRLLCDLLDAISEGTGIDRETIQNGGTS